jgi:hypothetical protein
MMACRALTASHPFVLTGWYGPVRQPHWLFLGFDRYAEALLVYGLKMRPPLSGAGLRITIVSENAQSTLNTLLDSYPAARELLDQVDVRSDVTEALDPGAYESCDRIGNTLQQTAIFVFAPNDSEAYTTAREVRLRTQTQNLWRVPVFMRLDNAKRFSPGIKSLKHLSRGDEVIEAFGETDELSQAQLFIDWQEDYAQKIHEDYRKLYSGTDHRSRQAFDPKTGWHQLTEQTRETNRRAVEHFVLNLVQNGYQYLGGKPVLERTPQFTEEQWADIARREHMSWTADKHLNGWRYNPTRNDRRQHHDCLRPFESLGEEVRKDLSQFSVIARQMERADAAITLLPEFRFGIILGDAVPTAKTMANAFEMLEEAMAESWQGQVNLLQFRLGQLNLGTNAFPAQLPADLKRRGEALQQVATTRIDLFLSSEAESGEAEQAAQRVVDHRNEYRADWERAIHDSPGIDRWLDLPSMGHSSDQPGELITEVFRASCHLTITLSSTDVRVEQATTMPYRDVFLPSLRPKKQ